MTNCIDPVVTHMDHQATETETAKIKTYTEIIIIIIIIIAFKGAVQDFLLSPLHCKLSPTRTLKWPGCNRVQIMRSISSPNHVQYVVLCATWYKGTAQLLSLTECKLHLF